VSSRKWKTSFWNTYEPEAGMSKASPDESFVYADADGNEEVSEKESLVGRHVRHQAHQNSPFKRVDC